MSLGTRIGLTVSLVFLGLVGACAEQAQPEPALGALQQALPDTTDHLRWVQRPLSAAGNRMAPVLAYDPVRKVSLLFGGSRGFAAEDRLAATRLWDGAHWTDPKPAHEPTAREAGSAVFDAAHGVVVLFGGVEKGSSIDLDDTWLWNGSDWTQPDRIQAPSARHNALMAFDASRERVVLFGGEHGNVASTETWEWQGGRWDNLSPAAAAPGDPPTSPSWGDAAALGYHAASNAMILVIVPPQVGAPPVSETWRWDGAHWTRLTPAHAPPTDTPSALVYDSARERLVLFPSYYEWDGQDWAPPAQAPEGEGPRVFADPYGRFAPAVFDDARKLFVDFDGNFPSDGALWERASEGGAWSQRDGGEPPITAGQCGQRIAFDAARSQLLLFDYSTETESSPRAIWSLDGNGTWHSRRDSTNMFRFDYVASFDAKRAVTLLFGGVALDPLHPDQLPMRPLAGFYAWDGDAYQVGADMKPDLPADYYGRHYVSLAYDSDRGRTIAFGGSDCYYSHSLDVAFICGISDRNTYEWDGKYARDDPAWITRAADADGPVARERSALAYDAARKRIVMFGGATSTGEFDGLLDDTWEYDGEHWQRMQPPRSPPARASHALIYDAARQRIVLFGGQNADQDWALADVWDWDGREWFERHPSGAPGRFHQPNFVYDSSRGAPVLLGAPTVNNSRLCEVSGAGMWELRADPEATGACNADAECRTGHCVEHLCCDQACGGNDTSDCQTCSAALGASADGVCTLLAQGTTCRTSAGECDVAELCTGHDGACPQDAYAPDTEICRKSRGLCDPPEHCSGSDTACPSDSLASSGSECRAAAGPCDLQEFCDGASVWCPADRFMSPSAVSCRVDACKEPVTCPGNQAACPESAPRPDRTACPGGVCMAGTCVPAAQQPDAGAQDGGVADAGPLAGPPEKKHDGGCALTARTSERDVPFFVLGWVFLSGLYRRRRSRVQHPSI